MKLIHVSVLTQPCGDRSVKRYGLQVQFSDGETVIQEDLSTDRKAVEAFCRQLTGQTADRDQLRYLIEDFVAKNAE